MASTALQEIESRLPELSTSEKLQLAQKLIEGAQTDIAEPKIVDWDKYRGMLKHGPDPLEYQRAIRAEWD